MEIQHHFQNIEPTDALKDYSNRVIEKLESHFSNLQNATVRFKVEKIDHICEISINGDDGHYIADEKAENMYASIDLVEKKLEKQIKKNKEKQLGKNKRGVK